MDETDPSLNALTKLARKGAVNAGRVAEDLLRGEENEEGML